MEAELFKVLKHIDEVQSRSEFTSFYDLFWTWRDKGNLTDDMIFRQRVTFLLKRGYITCTLKDTLLHYTLTEKGKKILNKEKDKN